jgi:hypothetical protein
MVLQERPRAVRHRYHANLGLTAVRTALALDPELALLPEDVLRSEVAMLADVKPGVEQPPDNEPLGGCLAGVGQTIRFFGSERFSRLLSTASLTRQFMRHWCRNTQPLRFPTTRLPSTHGARRWLSPEKTRGIAIPGRFRGGRPACVISRGCRNPSVFRHTPMYRAFPSAAHPTLEILRDGPEADTGAGERNAPLHAPDPIFRSSPIFRFKAGPLDVDNDVR